MDKTAKRIFVTLLFSVVSFSSFLLTAQEEKGEEKKEENKTEAQAPAPAPAPAPAEPAKPPRTNLFFRYGKLLAAEAVTEKPDISDPTRQMRLASGSVYAQLVFQADKGRSISIHDYVLEDEGGKRYKCVALAEGNAPYSGLNWIFRDTNGTTLYRMLFALPSGQGKFRLVFQHLESDLKMPFFLLKERSSYSTSFPSRGNLLLPKPPPPPAPPAEEKKEENKEENKEAGKETKEEKAP